MAKKSVTARNEKRRRTVEKYSAKRKELKAILSSSDTSDENFYLAQRKLAKLPRDASPIRVRNRCNLTSRPRAFNRRFGLSRITMRELAVAGKIPGLTKSSW